MEIYIRPQRVKAISLDLDDTLYDNRPVIANAETQLLAFMHQYYPKTLVWDRKDWLSLKRTILQSHPELIDDPSAARKEVLKQGLLKFGYSLQVAEEGAELGFNCFYHHRSAFKVDDAVLALLTTLSKDYRIIGITNGNVDGKAIGLSSVMEFVINAGNGLRMKPCDDMFKLACERLEIQPNELLHVGDSFSSDVMGARLFGAQSVWLNPALGREEADLSNTGLPHVTIGQLSELAALIKGH